MLKEEWSLFEGKAATLRHIFCAPSRLNVKAHYKRWCPGHNDVGIFSREKMVALDSVVPLRMRPRREGFRYEMELNYPLLEEKDQFLGRLNRVKQSLILKRKRSIDHLELLSFLLDLAEKVDQSEDQLMSTSASSSMLNTSGSYKVVKVIILHK